MCVGGGHLILSLVQRPTSQPLNKSDSPMCIRCERKKEMMALYDMLVCPISGVNVRNETRETHYSFDTDLPTAVLRQGDRNFTSRLGLYFAELTRAIWHGYCKT